MPYAKNKDAQLTQAVIDSINASDVRFSIFDGDFKDGSSVCSDASYKVAAAMLDSLRQPVVYVPGDNEWTDCHRSNNGGYNALERLSYLRRTLFSGPQSFGQNKLLLTHQGPLGQKFAENTRFIHGGIVFVGLNVPGSNNNWVMTTEECHHKSTRTQADCDADYVEYIERDEANIQWLKEGFEVARKESAKGVVLVIQASPGFDLPETELEIESNLPRYAGYQNFLKEVALSTARFNGQVLFVHGDDHYFKVDKPLHSPTHMLRNFTRVQTFGSPSNHWVRVVADSATPEVFTIHPVIVEKPSVSTR